MNNTNNKGNINPLPQPQQVTYHNPQQNLRPCPKCRTLIDKKAKVCPYCRKHTGYRPLIEWIGYIMLGLLILFMCPCFLAMCGSGGSNGDISADEPKAITTTAAESRELIEEKLNRSFKSSFGDNYTIDYDSETNLYSTSVWMEGISSSTLLASGGENEVWNEMAESMKEANIESYKQITKLDENAHIMFSMLDYDNKENTLLTIADGIIIYNAMDSLKETETGEQNGNS